jgi:hypothetical protein
MSGLTLDVRIGTHRNITVNGDRFYVGGASGAGCNCLIDTLNQLLKTCVSNATVRRDLQRKFPTGPNAVVEDNFLDFRAHWAAIIESLGRNSTVLPPGIETLRPNTYRIICVDLRYVNQGDAVGNPEGIKLHIARERVSHFVPLIRKW